MLFTPVTVYALFLFSAFAHTFILVPCFYVDDFNAVLYPDVDHLEVAPTFPFTDQVKVYGLTERWQWKHSDVYPYSCRLDSFHTISRIDMAFSSDAALPIVSGGVLLASSPDPLSGVFKLSMIGGRGGAGAM